MSEWIAACWACRDRVHAARVIDQVTATRMAFGEASVEERAMIESALTGEPIEKIEDRIFMAELAAVQDRHAAEAMR